MNGMNEVQALLFKLDEVQRARRAAPKGSDERWYLYVEESALWQKLRKVRMKEFRKHRNGE